MPRILILLPSATYRAADFLDAARRLGAEVVVASEEAQALAGSMGSRALQLDLDQPEKAAQAIVELAGRSPLDAVVAVDDQGVLVAALAAGALGLPHNPIPAVAATRDKASARAAMAAAGLPQPRWRLAPPGADVAALASEVGLPCVIKAVSLAASRGVIRADDAAEAVAAAQRVRAILVEAGRPPEEPVLVESYVEGTEVAVEGLLRAGALEVLAVFDKPDPLTGPYFEETIYVTPSRHPATVLGSVEAAVATAATALGLVEGPIHAEARIGDAGDVVVLELAARSIGGLCSRTLRFGTGVSLEELILRHALHLPLDPTREAAATGVMMLPIPGRGTLRQVRGQDEARATPGITGLELSINPGRPVRPLPEGDRYLGFLFARADTPAEVESALRTAHAHLEVVIDPA
jgi:biotin carboxylase